MDLALKHLTFSKITLYICKIWVILGPNRIIGINGSGVVKNPPTSAGDAGLIPGSGRSPRVGNGNLLQYSCLENSMNRGAWRAMMHVVTKSQTWLSNTNVTCLLFLRHFYRFVTNLSMNRAIHCTVKQGR